MKTSALYKEVAGIETSLKPGVPLSKQLVQERKKIEKSAIPPKGQGIDQRQGIIAITYKLPSDLAREIKAKAKEQGISQRELLRRALRQYFGGMQ